MSIRLAECVGFCFGVRRSLALAMEAASTGPVYSDGPLIHNPQEVRRLEEDFAVIALKEWDAVPDRPLLIRSHGVAPERFKEAERRGFSIIDATCPYVKEAQLKAAKLAKAGYRVAIVGDKAHPEVEGLIGWAGGNAYVIADAKSAAALAKTADLSKIGVIAQTTQTAENFHATLAVLTEAAQDIRVEQTICQATIEHQQAALALAQQVDTVVVVGGKNSSNSKKLAQICTGHCRVYHIETADELHIDIVRGAANIGVTAGASTPDWIIEEVVQKMTELEKLQVQEEELLKPDTASPEENSELTAALNEEASAPGDEPSYEQPEEEKPAEPEEMAGEETAAEQEAAVPEPEAEAVEPAIAAEPEPVAEPEPEPAQPEVVAEPAPETEAEPAPAPETEPEVEAAAEDAIPEPEPVLEPAPEEEPAPEAAEPEAEAEPAAPAKEAEAEIDAYSDMKEIRRGARVKGVVVQVKQDELLVDIGGKSEGVLSASELSAEEAAHITERFQVGDEINVLILRKENQEGYPVLSKKRVDQDVAWDRLIQLKSENAIVSGRVTEVVKGGLLVDVGVRGFIPASLVGLNYIEDLGVFVGKTLQLKIIECDKQNNKLVLSAKAVLRKVSQEQKEKTWAEIAVGQTLQGTVRRLTSFGAFVDVGGVDGLLHVSEMAWYRVNHPSDLLKEGDELNVYVLSVDAVNEKISLGLKQLIPNPWSVVKDKYPEGSTITAKVMRVTSFGAFLEVEPGVEGLAHISQLAHNRVEKTEDVVRPGDEVQVKILLVDPVAKRMSLSIKATLPKEEEAPEAPEVAEGEPLYSTDNPPVMDEQAEEASVSEEPAEEPVAVEEIAAKAPVDETVEEAPAE
jgi:4-hydroxy-3-methylbut-2-enyl diphosphate reductase